MANAIGVDRSTLTRFERGQQAASSAARRRIVELLATYYGQPVGVMQEYANRAFSAAASGTAPAVAESLAVGPAPFGAARIIAPPALAVAERPAAGRPAAPAVVPAGPVEPTDSPLRQMRHRLGLSLTQVVERSGIARSTLHRLEHGRQPANTDAWAPYIRGLARAYGESEQAITQCLAATFGLPVPPSPLGAPAVSQPPGRPLVEEAPTPMTNGVHPPADLAPPPVAPAVSAPSVPTRAAPVVVPAAPEIRDDELASAELPPAAPVVVPAAPAPGDVTAAPPVAAPVVAEVSQAVARQNDPPSPLAAIAAIEQALNTLRASLAAAPAVAPAPALDAAVVVTPASSEPVAPAPAPAVVAPPRVAATEHRPLRAADDPLVGHMVWMRAARGLPVDSRGRIVASLPGQHYLVEQIDHHYRARQLVHLSLMVQAEWQFFSPDEVPPIMPHDEG